jgi:hypothetical protein
LVWTATLALAFGLLSAPVFARLLPFGFDGHVAAFIMRGDRWHAGEALMQAQSPKAWTNLAAAAELFKPPNAATLEACREAAAKTKKEQHCTIVVPAT